jgi:RNA polymerase sigma-70 factor (ECF subfamily)
MLYSTAASPEHTSIPGGLHLAVQLPVPPHAPQPAHALTGEPEATTPASADRATTLEAIRPSLRRFLAVRLGNDEHLTDDLLQQVMLAATTGASIVPPAELEYWCRAVARNLVATHWRTHANRPKNLPIADASLALELAQRLSSEVLPSDILSRREMQDQLLLAITELDSADQDLVVAHYFRSESQAAIGARINASERAVEGRLYRARRALRDKLQSLA